MLIDTHCHLDFPEFKDDLDQVLNRALENKVKYIINVGSSKEGSERSSGLSLKYPNIFASCGIHPHHAKEAGKEDIKRIEDLISENKKIIAIGEVGLDFYRNLSPKKNQEDLFRSFLRLKEKTGLPLIIHSRQAKDETFDMLKSELHMPVDGVMHCFSQDADYLKKMLDMGFHVSFTANITYKNASKLKEVVKYVPLDKILLETDAPFLAPQNLRGKRNEPAYLIHLVEALSGILKVSKEDIEEKTTRNAIKLFRLNI